MTLKKIAFVGIALGMALAASRAQVALKASAFGNGGGLTAFGSNQINCTIGQAVIADSKDLGLELKSGFWQIVRFDQATGVGKEEETVLPDRYELAQNYPNPFNPTTTIRFALPKMSRVQLRLYDALGKEVGILADQSMPPGYHQVVLDAVRLSSGTYFYRLQTENFVQTRKMMLVK
jgi:Secretion system C-terminal sorting domain